MTVSERTQRLYESAMREAQELRKACEIRKAERQAEKAARFSAARSK